MSDVLGSCLEAWTPQSRRSGHTWPSKDIGLLQRCLGSKGKYVRSNKLLANDGMSSNLGKFRYKSVNFLWFFWIGFRHRRPTRPRGDNSFCWVGQHQDRTSTPFWRKITHSGVPGQEQSRWNSSRLHRGWWHWSSSQVRILPVQTFLQETRGPWTATPDLP